MQDASETCLCARGASERATFGRATIALKELTPWKPVVSGYHIVGNKVCLNWEAVYLFFFFYFFE